MQIGSTGASYPQTSVAAPAERTERGPDRDNDGDEGVKAAAAKPLPAPPPGRGGSVDMLA